MPTGSLKKKILVDKFLTIEYQIADLGGSSIRICARSTVP